MCSKCSECCQGSRHSVNDSPIDGSESELSGEILEKNSFLILYKKKFFFF